MKRDRYLGPWFLFLAACVATPPQIPAGEDPLRWQDAVEAFEAAAVLDPLPADAVLFVGSSSIRLWDSLHSREFTMSLLRALPFRARRPRPA